MECVYKNRNSEHSVSSRDVTNLPDQQDTISYVELYQQEIYVQEKIINWVEEGRNSSSQCTNKPVAFTSRRLDINYDNTYKEIDDTRESKRSVTCVKMFSSKRGQGGDLMETIVASNVEDELQGSVKQDSSSVFCCMVNSNTRDGKVVECDELDVEDYELMKDCSRESIPSVCCKGNKFKEPRYQQRFPVIDDQVEY